MHGPHIPGKLRGVRARRLRLVQAGGSGNQTAAAPPDEYKNCTSPAQFSGLQEGKWGLMLRATDGAGLISESRHVPSKCVQA